MARPNSRNTDRPQNVRIPPIIQRMRLIPTEPVAAKMLDGVEKTTLLVERARHGCSGSGGALTSGANHFIQNEKHSSSDSNLAIFTVSICLAFYRRDDFVMLNRSGGLSPITGSLPGTIAAVLSIHLFTTSQTQKLCSAAYVS